MLPGFTTRKQLLPFGRLFTVYTGSQKEKINIYIQSKVFRFILWEKWQNCAGVQITNTFRLSEVFCFTVLSRLKEEINFMQVHAQRPLKSRDSGASVLLLLVVPYFPCTVFLKSSWEKTLLRFRERVPELVAITKFASEDSVDESGWKKK